MTLHSQRFATETLIRLSEKIPNVSIILEYSIKPYRVDAYLPDHNISIEIDENDHHSYDPEKEFERSKFITNTLHCSWIRVNNSDTVENTVESLLKQLKYYGISSTTAIITKTAEIAQNKSYTQQLKEYKANLAEEAARVELEKLLHRGKGPSTTSFADVFEITHNSNDKLSYEDMEYTNGVQQKLLHQLFIPDESSYVEVNKFIKFLREQLKDSKSAYFTDLKELGFKAGLSAASLSRTNPYRTLRRELPNTFKGCSEKTIDGVRVIWGLRCTALPTSAVKNDSYPQ